MKKYKLPFITIAIGALIITSFIDRWNKSYKNSNIVVLPKIDEQAKELPEVKRYVTKISELYKKGIFILPIDDNLDENRKKAQELAINDKEFIKDTKNGNKILRSEITKIAPIDVKNVDNNLKKSCLDSVCYVVQKYNYANNLTTEAIVDVAKSKVIKVNRYNKKPYISNRIKKLAKIVAIKSDNVLKKLRVTPTIEDNKALQDRYCQDNDLCLSAKVTINQKARWSIVDLNRLKVIATKLEDLNNTLTNLEQNITKTWDKNISKYGWELKYSSDSFVNIGNITFNGKKVANSIKMVNLNVEYANFNVDRFDRIPSKIIEGQNREIFIKCNDYRVCYAISTSNNLKFNPIKIIDIKKDSKIVGFELVQEFNNYNKATKCNIQVKQLYKFYNNGSFETEIINLSKNCVNKIFLKPIFQFDINLDNKEQFGIFNGQSYDFLQQETTILMNNQDNKFAITNVENINNGFYINPYFENGGFIYVTNFNTSINNDNCCNINDENFENIINKKLIENEDIIFWYIPTLVNNSVGIKFNPIKE